MNEKRKGFPVQAASRFASHSGSLGHKFVSRNYGSCTAGAIGRKSNDADRPTHVQISRYEPCVKRPFRPGRRVISG